MGVYLDRAAVQDCRFIAPLADSGESGLIEQRIAGNHFERLNGAVGGDDGAKFDAAFTSHLFGKRRIDWFDTEGKHCWLELADGYAASFFDFVMLDVVVRTRWAAGRTEGYSVSWAAW